MKNLSLEQVKKIGNEIQALRNKHEKAIQKADDVIEHGIDATLVSATAFGLGVWQTRASTRSSWAFRSTCWSASPHTLPASWASAGRRCPTCTRWGTERWPRTSTRSAAASA